MSPSSLPFSSLSISTGKEIIHHFPPISRVSTLIFSKRNRHSSIDSLHLFSSDLIIISVVRTDVCCLPLYNLTCHFGYCFIVPRHFLCRIYDFVSNYLLKESLISLVREFLLCSTFWLLSSSLVSMVCTLGRGRMAVMARLLTSGNFPEATAEEVKHEKLAAQSIYRELHEADEANLLEEEDMHVFDCKPMIDPLNLVCCNACKKPVKASQFAAHAERCRTLNFKEDIGLELDGGTGHKKPPRKGRKKSQTVRDTPAVVEQERSESIDGDETAAELNMDDQTGLTSSLSREAKRALTLINGTLVTDGSGVSIGSTNYPVDGMSPSEKRTKLCSSPPCNQNVPLTKESSPNCTGPSLL